MKEYIVTEHPDFPYEEPKPQELIRCKDCAHHKEKRCTVWRERAVIVECYTDDDGFCYKGEPND